MFFQARCLCASGTSFLKDSLKGFRSTVIRMHLEYPPYLVAGNVKEPTRFSVRVGNVALSVVVRPRHCLHRPPFKPALSCTGPACLTTANTYIHTYIYIHRLRYDLRFETRDGLARKSWLIRVW